MSPQSPDLGYRQDRHTAMTPSWCWGDRGCPTDLQRATQSRLLRCAWVCIALLWVFKSCHAQRIAIPKFSQCLLFSFSPFPFFNIKDNFNTLNKDSDGDKRELDLIGLTPWHSFRLRAAIQKQQESESRRFRLQPAWQSLSQHALILALPEFIDPDLEEWKDIVRGLFMTKSPTVSQYGVGKSLHLNHRFNIWHVREAKQTWLFWGMSMQLPQSSR